MRRMLKRIFLILFCPMIITGCFPPPEQTVTQDPAPKAWTADDLAALVHVDYKAIDSSAPADNGQPPAACDKIRYMSLAPENGKPDPDAVVLVAPGMELGVGALTNLAENLIYVARTGYGIDLKVLLVERRGNCLEDLSGVNAAEAAGDIQSAVDYYYRGKSIDGSTFQGFLTGESAPYTSEFGIKLNVEDIYAVITAEVPDPAVRRQKLFLAGHSISGFTLGIFAGWDFDGDPSTLDDAGYRNCAGFIALDTLISPLNDIAAPLTKIFPEGLRTQIKTVLREQGYAPAVARLRDGRLPKLFANRQIPEAMMLTELAAMQADWAPNAESTFLKAVPYSDNADHYFDLIMAGTYSKYLNEQSYKAIRCTNLAFCGLLVDNNFFPITPFANGMGFLGNGPVADKTFPLPTVIERFPELVDLTQLLIDPNLYYPTQKRSTLYRWINFDEIQSSPYTTPIEEVVDVYDYIKTAYVGPTNYYEWYFPNRVLVDLMAISENGRLGDDSRFYHGDFEGKVPILNFFCEHGIVLPFPEISARDHVYIAGYRHADILAAAANRLSRRPHEVIAPLIEFILKEKK